MIDKMCAGLVSHLDLVDPAGWESSCWPLEDPLLDAGGAAGAGAAAVPDETDPTATPTRSPAVGRAGR